MHRIRLLLLPLSMLYFVAIWLRNKLYDLRVFKSQRVNTPTLVIGNLTVGGTGKSPHTMWIAETLNEEAALLSRGYGRKSRGFVLASPNSNFLDIGDEPFMMLKRFAHRNMAVCEDRIYGCKQIRALFPQTQLILLDDAYQHRRLQADRYVLLCDYARPFYADWMLPAGHLRDICSQASRADSVWVTKCPPDLGEQARAQIVNQIGKHSSAPVFFSRYTYSVPRQIASGNEVWINDAPTWAFCGIAQPGSFEDYTRSHFTIEKFTAFNDHHHFSEAETNKMISWLKADSRHQLLTTEKDAMRLLHLEELANGKVFQLPLSIAWIGSSPHDLIRSWFSTMN